MLGTIPCGISAATPGKGSLGTLSDGYEMTFADLSVTLRHDHRIQGWMAKPDPSHVGVDRPDADLQTCGDIAV